MKAHKKNKSREIARDRYWSKHEKQTYRCPDCDRSVDEIKGTFEVHHKNGSAYDNRMQNLIGLCGLCHALREDKKPSKDRIKQVVSCLSSDPTDPGDTSDEEPTTQPMRDLTARDPGYGHEFEAVVSVVNDGRTTRKAQGRLEGPNGTYITYVVPGGNDIEVSAYEHDYVYMKDVKIQTNDYGLLEAVIDDVVTIRRTSMISPGDGGDDNDVGPVAE